MRAVRLVLLTAACAIVSDGAAIAASVSVPLDEVRLVAFKQPVATIYLGNSSIAEVTLVDSRHAFVLGKTFGTTNLIALARDNSVIVNEPVTVFGNRANAVTLNRGAETYNYTCTRLHCETSPVPGDAKDYFANTTGEATEHEATATTSANTGQQQH